MHKIVLIEDHRLFRLAVSSILSQEENLNLIKEYDDPEDALGNIEYDNPDLYLIDITLGEKSGLEFVKSINRTHPDIKLIMLSMHKEEYYLIKSIEHDVDGYIHKDVEPDDLLMGIKKVLNGHKYYSSEVSNIIINNVYSKVSEYGEVPTLTNREKEIIKFIAEGLSSKEISEILSLSPRTIETHRGRILNKLNLRNTAELVRLAVEQKIV